MHGTSRLALALSVTLLALIAAPSAPAATPEEMEKWGEHMGDLPFIVGQEAGLKDVEFTGRPPMYFFTATW